MISSSVDSVIVGIVAYNTEIEVLSAALNSLNDSTFLVQTVVLCNSPVETYQQNVISLCHRFGVLCLDHQPNQGFGAGHNRIANALPGKWYVCCNPDITVYPETISALLEFAQMQKDAVLLAPKVLYPDGRVQPLARKHLTVGNWVHRQLWRIFPRIFKPYELKFDYDRSQPAEFVSGCFFMVSRKKFLALGGFDEKFFLYAEDADLSLRASSIGVNYYVSDSKIVHIWTTNLRHNKSALYHELRSLGCYFWRQMSKRTKTREVLKS